MRNVVVTGGTRGLGLAIAKALAACGYQVIAVARKQGEALSESDATPNAQGGRILFRAFDLNNLQDIQGFVADISKEFGSIYGLINNAAIGTSGILATMQDPQIERLLTLNVTSPITMTKYAVRSMMVGGDGRIVNISSIIASTGYSGLSVYAATKSALTGFTRSLARELGPLGITVNAIAPGFLETEMTDGMADEHLGKIRRRSALRRLAEPAEVASAVCYLLSESARNITGTTITIDAGNTA